MKKNYVIPRTTSVDVMTESHFALTLSAISGQGNNGRGGYLFIGNGSNDDYIPGASAKGGFWDV